MIEGLKSKEAYIVSGNPITVTQVENIVKKMPSHLKDRGAIKQDVVPFDGWGWSAGADILCPKDNTLKISQHRGTDDYIFYAMIMFFIDKLHEMGHVSLEWA